VANKAKLRRTLE